MRSKKRSSPNDGTPPRNDHTFANAEINHAAQKPEPVIRVAGKELAAAVVVETMAD